MRRGYLGIPAILFCLVVHVASRAHSQEVVGAASTPAGDFDVLANSYDANGFPLNPFWRWQSKPGNEKKGPNPSVLCKSGLPDGEDCTSQKTWENLPHFPKVLICMWELQASLIGHINWIPATYEGGVLWKERSTDQDCNFATKPNNNNGLTAGSFSLESGYLGLEFDSRETIENMNTDPWATLSTSISGGKSSDDINRWLSTHVSGGNWPYMIVTGLFGVDCEHDCHTELHPVFEMAIQTNPSADDNTWGIMMRNWGNEGFCAHGEVNLDQRQLSIFLPHTGSKPDVLASTKFYSTDGSSQPPDMTFVSDPNASGLLLTFKLPPASTKPIEELELHLKWPDGSQGPSAEPRPPSVASPVRAAPANVEDYLEKVKVEGATPTVAVAAVRKTVKVNLPSPYPIKELSQFVRVSAPPERLNISIVTNPEEEAQDRVLFRRLCAKYKNNPPGIPAGVCKSWLAQNKK